MQLKMFFISICFLICVSQMAAQQSPSSLVVVPTETASLAWTAYLGGTSFSLSPLLAPDGSTIEQFVVNDPGNFGDLIICQETFPSPVDFTRYDSFYFFITASATRIGDWVYLVDIHNNRRWFPLAIRSYRGWQQPVYWISKYSGQDPLFDPIHVASVRFGQAGQRPGDILYVGPVRLANSTVATSNVSSTWTLDVGSGNLTTSKDSATGRTMVVANVIADVPSLPGQVDIAINGLNVSGIHWDWTGKRFIRFDYRDFAPNGVLRYFYFGTVCSLTSTSLNSPACVCSNTSCTINGSPAGDCDSLTCRSFRQYVFDSSAYSGAWTTISAALDDRTARDWGHVDLSDINWFEVGLIQGTANATYTLHLGTVRVD